MLRTLAWVLVVWGVAVWATWGFYLLLGIAPPEKALLAGVGGGILVALGYWLERKTRRQPAAPRGEESPPADRA